MPKADIGTNYRTPVDSRTILPALTLGFLAATCADAAWFALSFPGLGIPRSVIGLSILVVFAGALVLGTRAWRPPNPIATGAAAGLVGAAVQLLVLGSFFTDAPGEAASAAPVDPTLRPDAWLMIVGFLSFAVGLGAGAGALARRSGGGPIDSNQTWLSRFALVGVVSTFLLVLAGGLVTSADAGLAVADWPTTRAANMFLYPLSLMSHPRVFLEHSHRLLGSMVGLTTLVLAVLVAIFDSRRRDRLLGLALGLGIAAGLGGLMAASSRGAIPDSALVSGAIVGLVLGLGMAIAGLKRNSSVMVAFALLALVTAQGVLGGTRVTQQSQALALVHGMLAMVFFSLVVAQATWLKPAWIQVAGVADRSVRRLRTMSTALLHTLYVQILMGAMYRHMGSKGVHALYTHIAVSMAVLGLATLCAASAARAGEVAGNEGGRLRRARLWLLVTVSLQMALGIGALVVVMMGASRGPLPTSADLEQAPATPAHEVLLTTLHHANGAALLGVAMATFLWARRLWRPQGT